MQEELVDGSQLEGNHGVDDADTDFVEGLEGLGEEVDEHALFILSLGHCQLSDLVG